MVIISKYSNTVEYNLKTTLDASGLNKLQTELSSISHKLREVASQDLISDKQKQEALKTVSQVQQALTKSFNGKIGMLDTSQLKKNLGDLNLVKIQQDFRAAGAEGEVAFGRLVASIGKVNVGLKSTTSALDKVKNTIFNTVRWGVVSSAYNQITNSIYESVQYMKDLDDSLTQIMLVTDYSRENMNDFAKSANEAAKSLGSTTTAMTNASLVFAQQGFNLDQSSQLAELSTKLANASQQDTATTSDQITAYMNAYGLDKDMNALHGAMDAWAQVANVSAADVAELAQASQKAASTANTVGVSMDQLNGQIAAIESVTREAPEQIGNGLKTLYARFSDLEAGETLEDGVSLGKVTAQLEKYGVQVLNGEGQMRGVGDIMEDLMEVWSSLDQTQKAAVAQTVAGKYQLSRFEALMNRSDLYDEYKGASESADGTLNQMNEEFVDSLEGRMNKLHNSMESVFSSLFNTDDVYPLIDAITNLIELLDGFIQSIGGSTTALKSLGAVALKTFSKDIGETFVNMKSNFTKEQTKKDNSNKAKNILDEMGFGDIDKSQMQESLNFIEQGLDRANRMTDAQLKTYNQQVDNLTEAESKLAKIRQEQKDMADMYTLAYKAVGVDFMAQLDESGNINTKGLEEQAAARTELSQIDIANIDWSTINKQVNGASKQFSILTKAFEENAEGAEKSIIANDKLVGTWAVLGDMIENISAETGGANGNFEDMRKAFDMLSNAIGATTTDGRVDVEAFTAALSKMKKALVDTGSVARTLQKKGGKNLTAEAAQAKNAEAEKAQSDLDNLVVPEAKRFVKDMDTAIAVQDIANIASAIGDLTVAWSGFQALGSLWAQEDLSFGEKLLQTVSNLVFILPQLAAGIKEFQNLGVLSGAVGVLNKAGSKLIAVGEGAAVAGPAIIKFGKILANLVPQGKAIMMILGGLATALTTFGFIAETTKKQTEDILSAGQEAATQLQATNNLVPTYEKAYQSFKQTGIVTEELKNSIKGLADTYNLSIDIDNLKASSIERINDALRTQKELNSTLSHNQLVDAQREIANKKENRSSGTKIKSYNGGRYRHGEKIAQSTNAKFEDELTKEFSTMTRGGFVQDVDLSQKLGDLKDAELYIDNKIKELQEKALTATPDKKKQIEIDIAAWERVGKAKRDAIGISAEDQSTWEQQQRILADDQASILVESLKGQRLPIEEARKEILNNADIAHYVTSQGKEAGKLYVDGILEQLGYSASEIQTGLKSFYTDPDTSVLDAANKHKDSLGGLVTKYQEKGYFTEDETADLIEQNPEYLDYLVQVGDNYQLNEKALKDWNLAVEAQDKAINDLMDSSFKPLLKVNEQLNRSLTVGLGSINSSTGILDIQKLTQDLVTTNQELVDGAISFEEYTGRLGSSINDLNSLNVDWSDLESSGLNDEEIQNLAIAWAGLGDSIETTMQQMTRQLKRGEISLSDYYSNFADMARQSNKVQEGLGKIRKEGEKWVPVLKNVNEETAKNNRKLAEQANATEKAADNLDSLNKVHKKFEKFNSELMEWFGEGVSLGEIDLSAIEQAGNHYKEVISGIAADMGDFFKNNTEEITKFSDTLIQQGIVNSQEAQKLQSQLQQGQTQYLQQLVAENGQAGAALVAQTLAATSSQVQKASAGIQMMISGVETIINSMKIKITGKQVDSKPFSGTLLSLKGGSGLLGGLGEIAGDVPYSGSLPVFEFSANASGSDSSGGVKRGADQLASGLFTGGFMDGANLSDYGSGGASPASSTSFKNPGGSGGKGSGGKGGGGGKGYTAKENKDPIDNEVDRYEKVNTQLGAISADYEKINSEQERLTGDKLAKNLQEQNKLLLRQIELYQEKLKIQQQEAEEVKNKLSSQFGITYDSEGFMTNYAKVHQQLIDEVNRIGNQYAGLGSEEAEKALDKQYEAAQKRLDTFEELYQRYDELLSSDLKDTIQQIEDLKDSIEDMRIEIFKTSVEALDNIRDIRKELAEFNQSSKIWFDDDPFEKAKESVLQLGEFWDGAIKDVDKYYDELIAKEQEAANKATTSEGKLYHNNRILQLQKAKADQGKESLDYLGTGFFDMQFSNVMDMMKEIEEFEKTGSSTVFGENSAAMYETALDVLKQANSTLNDYKDNVTELRDLINEMLDEILEKQEERQNAYENINDELEHQIELITMIHGEEAYSQLKKAYAAQLINTKNQISEMNQTLAANKELLAQMEAAGDTSSDAYKALKENIADTQKELNSLVQSSIENIRKQQELAVKSITDAWVKDALGTDLDWMQTEWELINRNADYYLDDVNKAYNIQKLQGKYLELLDQSNDLGIQNQITAQMKEQLKYLREKKNLSEYDVQYANAQLEILQKRIVLEEAQRNKSQMKLRRDSQGNYSYVYTANEGDVANAQSGLLDAQNNAYNLSKEQMKQTQADSLSALADAKSLIDSIWTNANLSLEEKKKRTETIIGSLKEYLAATSEQLGVSEQNIINDFLGMCEVLTDENKTGLQETYEEIVNGNKDAFDKIDDRWSTSLTGWLENLDKFNQDTTDKFDSLYDEMEEYESEIDNIGDLVGQNFDDMTGSIQGTLDKTEELRTSTQGFISDLQKMSGAVADAEKSMAYYRDKITEANNEMSMYQQKVNELGSKLEQAEREKADMRAEIQKMQDAEAARQQAANGGNGAGGAGSGGGANGQANSAMAWGIAQAIWTYGGKSGWGNDPIRSSKLKKAYGDAFAREVQNIINQNARSGKLVNYDSMKYSSYNLIGYDTGGYTGSWNDNTFDSKNGKLAVLHQKELILNATDTENILATVSAVRDLVAGLKTQALNGLSTAFAIGGVATKETAQDINQNVHITAEFPNVSSSSEIENALLNLNERAIQYAFKNN